ncbi:alpha/beta hydrolase family esterase [Sorangium sp. So ce513]|uniref:alpha/beta hydrolase family esterase n=1 Tax=Sorangium sp. So ce513 TaxID=3133315 RepID=UPI003F621757
MTNKSTIARATLFAALVGSLALSACSGDGGGGDGGSPPDGDAQGGTGGAAVSGSGGGTGATTTTGDSGATTVGTGGEGGMGGGGGAPGTGGSGGSTDVKAPPQPSTGCNKPNPQTGSAQSPLTVAGHQYYVKLPTGYDASKPYPVMIMFNPTGNPISWAEQNAGFEAAGPREAWIRVYPHPANSNSGWGANDVSFFQPFYDQITDNYCIDKARVFAAGESSGGDFSSILGCEHADKLRAIGPCATKNVPQYPLNANTRQCTGQVTSVVIHGKRDSVVGTENGPKTRDFYTQLNHCEATTTPVEGYTDDLSNCVMYQGCDDDYPVYWCLHGDPNYSNTNHGWPAFAPKFLWSLFSTY